jgi:Regulator of ribonuclease activity B
VRGLARAPGSPWRAFVRRHMSWPIVAIIVVVAIATLLFALNRNGREAAPDIRGLSLLRQGGSDLSKPHQVEFFLHFASKEDGDRVAEKLRLQGFVISRSESSKGVHPWTVVATRSMVPEVTELVRLRSTLTELAAAEHGDYDGWGSPVVK